MISLVPRVLSYSVPEARDRGCREQGRIGEDTGNEVHIYIATIKVIRLRRMDFFLDIFLRSKRSPCANFRTEKRKLLPSSAGDGYGTQLRNRTETVLLEYGVLELSYGISYVFFFPFLYVNHQTCTCL